jgi:phosphohistidine phosphatase
MQIYLVRHAKASKDPQYAIDAERPLTGRGQDDIARIAAQLAAAGVEVHQIRHSGLLRARQTAEILGEHLTPPDGVIPVAGLHYADPVETLADELHLELNPVMLVGHNPFMERLASRMLTGSVARTPIWFSTSSTVYLEYIEGMWSVRWALSPKVVPLSD